MKRLDKPNYKSVDILQVCIDSMHSVPQGLSSFKSNVDSAEKEYLQYSSTQDFQLIGKCKFSESDILNYGITKKEFLSVYFSKFLKNKAPRKIYDEIMLSSSNCVYCNMDSSISLDHFLPQSKYPYLSLTPANLLPCCASCNQKKSNIAPAHKDEVFLHPYFEDRAVFKNQWLVANVTFTNNAPLITYRIDAPNSWNEQLKERLGLLVKRLDLLNRYRDKALIKYADIKELLANVDNAMNVMAALSKSTKKNAPNSWEAAFYEGMLQYFRSSQCEHIATR